MVFIYRVGTEIGPKKPRKRICFAGAILIIKHLFPIMVADTTR